jgi:hypothetical protein
MSLMLLLRGSPKRPAGREPDKLRERGPLLLNQRGDGSSGEKSPK